MEYCTTIGADVSDRTTKICVMTKADGGERRIVVETTCATTKAGFEEAFSKFDRSWPVVFETGTHCRWMDRLFRRMGFKTIVGNPGKIPSITKSNTKNDRNDARELARLAIADPAMLHPVFLRDEVYQQMLRFHHARNVLLSQRTQTINQIRGFAKSMGYRIECSSTEKFHELGKADWPRELEECAWPLMGVLKAINLKIKAYDKLIARLAERPEFKPMVERVRVVYGVGTIGSTVFVAAIGGRPDRFDRVRDIGPYFGMIPKQDQSGDDDKQLHITHAGPEIVRTALVECAGVVMMEKSKDTDLKLKGLRIAMRGGKIARKKAKVAVARGLAVAMLALLQHPEREYVPLSEEGKKGFERYRAEMEYLTMQKASRKDKKVA
ncbi:MAG: IS110 family transposase [Kiritimatiellae bacterium]|jgi:transposase|nr:IS110 family transposase [Kiritimatiellia bacterium]